MPKPAWSSSDRAQRLPPDWNARRRTVLDRDPRCQLHYACICTGRSTEVDHKQRGDDHRLSNLQGVCAPCHKRKTSGESQQSRGVGPSRKRPKEDHPGLR